MECPFLGACYVLNWSVSQYYDRSQGSKFETMHVQQLKYRFVKLTRKCHLKTVDWSVAYVDVLHDKAKGSRTSSVECWPIIVLKRAWDIEDLG